MKKILFGSAAAICAVVGFSSFKPSVNGTITYYYFQVSNNQAGTTTAAINHAFDNNHIGNFLGATTTLSDPSGCSGGSNWCAAGFTWYQVIPDPTNPASFILYTDALSGSSVQLNRIVDAKP